MKIHTEGLSEIVLEVSLMERAVEFWSKRLGFPIVERWGYSDGQFDETSEDIWATWLYIGGTTRLGLWLPRDFTEKQQKQKGKPVSQWEGFFDEGGIHVHFALQITEANILKAIEILKEEGIDHKVVEECEVHSELRVYFKDTEANVIEFYTRDMKQDYINRRKR